MGTPSCEDKISKNIILRLNYLSRGKKSICPKFIKNCLQVKLLVYVAGVIIKTIGMN
jgi:hypothetical protein